MNRKVCRTTITSYAKRNRFFLLLYQAPLHVHEQCPNDYATSLCMFQNSFKNITILSPNDNVPVHVHEQLHEHCSQYLMHHLYGMHCILMYILKFAIEAPDPVKIIGRVYRRATSNPSCIQWFPPANSDYIVGNWVGHAIFLTAQSLKLTINRRLAANYPTLINVG